MDNLTPVYIIFILLVFWTAKAEVDFFRLYKVKKNPKYPITAKDISEYYFSKPYKWIVEAPSLTVSLLNKINKNYEDSELQTAAEEVRKRIKIVVAFFVFSGLIKFLII